MTLGHICLVALVFPTLSQNEQTLSCCYTHDISPIITLPVSLVRVGAGVRNRLDDTEVPGCERCE